MSCSGFAELIYDLGRRHVSQLVQLLAHDSTGFKIGMTTFPIFTTLIRGRTGPMVHAQAHSDVRPVPVLEHCAGGCCSQAECVEGTEGDRHADMGCGRQA